MTSGDLPASNNGEPSGSGSTAPSQENRPRHRPLRYQTEQERTWEAGEFETEEFESLRESARNQDPNEVETEWRSADGFDVEEIGNDEFDVGVDFPEEHEHPDHRNDGVSSGDSNYRASQKRIISTNKRSKSGPGGGAAAGWVIQSASDKNPSSSAANGPGQPGMQDSRESHPSNRRLTATGETSIAHEWHGDGAVDPLTNVWGGGMSAPAGLPKFDSKPRWAGNHNSSKASIEAEAAQIDAEMAAAMMQEPASGPETDGQPVYVIPPPAPSITSVSPPVIRPIAPSGPSQSKEPSPTDSGTVPSYINSAWDSPVVVSPAEAARAANAAGPAPVAAAPATQKQQPIQPGRPIGSPAAGAGGVAGGAPVAGSTGAAAKPTPAQMASQPNSRQVQSQTYQLPQSPPAAPTPPATPTEPSAEQLQAWGHAKQALSKGQDQSTTKRGLPPNDLYGINSVPPPVPSALSAKPASPAAPAAQVPPDSAYQKPEGNWATLSDTDFAVSAAAGMVAGQLPSTGASAPSPPMQPQKNTGPVPIINHAAAPVAQQSAGAPGSPAPVAPARTPIQPGAPISPAAPSLIGAGTPPASLSPPGASPSASFSIPPASLSAPSSSTTSNSPTFGPQFNPALGASGQAQKPVAPLNQNQPPVSGNTTGPISTISGAALPGGAVGPGATNTAAPAPPKNNTTGPIPALNPQLMANRPPNTPAQNSVRQATANDNQIFKQRPAHPQEDTGMVKVNQVPLPPEATSFESKMPELSPSTNKLPTAPNAETLRKGSESQKMTVADRVAELKRRESDKAKAQQQQQAAEAARPPSAPPPQKEPVHTESQVQQDHAPLKQHHRSEGAAGSAHIRQTQEKGLGQFARRNAKAIVFAPLIAVLLLSGSAIVVLKHNPSMLNSQQPVSANEQSGQESLKTGKFTESVGYFDEALKNQPNQPRILYGRGKAFFGMGNYRAALQDYSAALKAAPAEQSVLLDRAATYFYMRNFDEAIADYTTLLRSNPKSAEALMGRALNYEKSNQSGAALKDLDQVIDLQRDNKAAWLEEGLILTKMKSYERAIATLDQAIILDPKSPEAVYWRGNAYRKCGKKTEAIRDFSSAISLAPGESDYYNDRGCVLLDTQKYREAMTDFATALALKPDDKIAADNLARANKALLKEVTVRLSVNNKNPHTLCDFAYAYIINGRYDDAVGAAQNAIEIQNDSTDAHQLLGQAKFAQGKYQESVEAETEALKSDPNNLKALLWRARASVQLNHCIEAKSDYDRCVDATTFGERYLALRERALVQFLLRDGSACVADVQRYLGEGGWHNQLAGSGVLLSWLANKQLLRNNETAAAILRDAAHKLKPDQWPYPIVRYLLKDITATDLLSSAKTPQQLTDVRTWTGFDNLLEGNTTGATSDLGHVKNKGVKSSEDYLLVVHSQL